MDQNSVPSDYGSKRHMKQSNLLRPFFLLITSLIVLKQMIDKKIKLWLYKKTNQLVCFFKKQYTIPKKSRSIVHGTYRHF